MVLHCNDYNPHRPQTTVPQIYLILQRYKIGVTYTCLLNTLTPKYFYFLSYGYMRCIELLAVQNCLNMWPT